MKEKWRKEKAGNQIVNSQCPDASRRNPSDGKIAVASGQRYEALKVALDSPKHRRAKISYRNRKKKKMPEAKTGDI